MNIAVKLKQTDRVVIRNVPLAWLRKEGLHHVFSRVDDPLRLEILDDAALNEAMRDDPSWRFEPGRDDPSNVLTMARTGVGGIWLLPPKQQTTAHFRAEWCGRFKVIEMEGRAKRSDASMKVAIKTIFADMCGDAVAARDGRKASACNAFSGKNPPSPKTLRRWLVRFEAGNCQPDALFDCRHERSGNHDDRLAPEVSDLIAEHVKLFAAEERPTRKVIREGFYAALQDLNERRTAAGLAAFSEPSKEVFNKRIREMDAFAVKAGRHGRKAALAEFRICHDGVDVSRPLQRVTVDCYKVHLHAVLAKAGLWNRIPESDREKYTKRFWLCLALDSASRVVLGMVLSSSPSAEVALATLDMVTRDKGALATETGALTPWDMRGSPTTIVTDRGSEFANDAFKSAVAALRANQVFPPAGTPTMRGDGERIFATIGSQVLPYFTGRTFSNTVDAGDYPSQERACLSPEQLAQVLVRWVVDCYHNTPHAGLRGETPRQAWLRLTHAYGVVPPPDRHVRRAVFGRKLVRTVGPYGVQVCGLFYQHPDLHSKVRLRRKNATVDVRLDVQDMGRISVLIDGEWRVAACREPDMDNVTLAEWQGVVQDLRTHFAQGEQVRRDVVRKAFSDFRAIASAAKASILLPDAITSAEVDRLEETLFANLPRIDWDDEVVVPVTPSDPLADAESVADLVEEGSSHDRDDGGPSVAFSDPRKDDDVEMGD